MKQIGGACSLCGAEGTNKTTCPLNPNAERPNPRRHKKAAVAALAPNFIYVPSNFTLEFDHGYGVLYINSDDENNSIEIVLDRDILEAGPESITEAANGTVLGTEHGTSSTVTISNGKLWVTEKGEETRVYVLPTNFGPKVIAAYDEL